MVMTHLAAMLVGCVAWKVSAGKDFLTGAPDGPVPKAIKVARDRSEATRRDTPDGPGKAERLRHGEAVLGKIAGTDAAMPESAADGDPGMEPADLIRLADSLEPDGDPEAAVRRAMERYQGGRRREDCRELEARHLLWLRTDAKAALDSPLPPGLTAVRAITLERGWREMLQYRNNGPLLQVWRGICEDFAREGTPPAYGEIKAVMADHEKRHLLDNLASYWPMEKADGLLELLAEDAGNEIDLNKVTETLLEFAKKNGVSGARWLLEKMESPAMDKGMKNSVGKTLQYRDLILDTPQLGPERRKKLDLEAIDLWDKGASDEKKAERYFRDDMEQLLVAERDWRYAFRHGAVDAEEVMDAMRKEQPAQADQYPEALRRALYANLVEENPAAAMALLGHLPEEERWRVALATHVNRPGADDPRAAFAFLQQIPPAMADGLWEERLSMWEFRGHDAITLEAPYLRWLESLPPGVDRDMAVYRAMKAIQNRREEFENEPDAGWPRRMVATIRDPRLLQRIKKEEKRR